MLHLKAVDLVEDKTFHMPVTQGEIANATGMMLVPPSRDTPIGLALAQQVKIEFGIMKLCLNA